MPRELHALGLVLRRLARSAWPLSSARPPDRLQGADPSRHTTKIGPATIKLFYYLMERMVASMTPVRSEGKPVRTSVTACDALCRHGSVHTLAMGTNQWDRLMRTLKWGCWHSPSQPQTEVIVFFDMRNYSLANADLRAAVQVLHALQASTCTRTQPTAHFSPSASPLTRIWPAQTGYPERLHRCVMFMAPRIFFVLWKAIKPFLDERLSAKARGRRSIAGGVALRATPTPRAQALHSTSM